MCLLILKTIQHNSKKILLNLIFPFNKLNWLVEGQEFQQLLKPLIKYLESMLQEQLTLVKLSPMELLFFQFKRVGCLDFAHSIVLVYHIILFKLHGRQKKKTLKIKLFAKQMKYYLVKSKQQLVQKIKLKFYYHMTCLMKRFQLKFSISSMRIIKKTHR